MVPYVKVLGIAQDGGCPQLGGEHANDRKAVEEPRHRRHASSIAVFDPESGERWLFDATPDIREQVEMIRGEPPSRKPAEGRPPLFEAIFLTHGHMGHYTGLLHFGREAYASKEQVVYGSESMVKFLKANAPWEMLSREKHIDLKTLKTGETLDLNARLRLEVLTVPHRSEYTDTLAFIIRGPNQALLYLPDIDKWDRWEIPLEDALDRVNYALVDGTFFGDGEIPDRSMADIPHPFMVETIERLSKSPKERREKLWFIHLNHTNPALDPQSEEAKQVKDAGLNVATEKLVFEL